MSDLYTVNMKVFLSILLLLVLVACPMQPPNISSFTADKVLLPYGGGAVILTWEAQRASSISLNAGIGDVSQVSSQSVQITVSTNFILTVSNAAGSVTQSLQVDVAPPPAPVISSFTATPNTLPAAGGKVKLAWVTENTTTLSIDQSIGTVTGSEIEVSVSTSTNFTLTATGLGGTITKSVGVFVAEAAPVISSFTATPNATENESVLLEWSVLGATSLSISPNIGTVIGSSVIVNPTKTTTFYTLTATNGGGSTTKSVTVGSTALSSTPLGTINLAWDTSKRTAETDSSGQVSFLPLTYSDIDFVAGGVRYLTATYRVTNLSTAPLENIALRAVNKTNNLGGTAYFDVRSFPDTGNPDGILFSDVTVAQRILPLHAMQLGASTPVPDAAGSHFMAYRTNESTAFDTAARANGLLGSTENTLDYAFVAQTSSSRVIAPGATGIVSVAVQLPRRFDPLPKVFKFQTSFIVSTDNAPRVSRALLETTAMATTRATELGTATNPAQLVLIGADADAPTDTAFRVIRLANIRTGTSTNLLP